MRAMSSKETCSFTICPSAMRDSLRAELVAQRLELLAQRRDLLLELRHARLQRIRHGHVRRSGGRLAAGRLSGTVLRVERAESVGEALLLLARPSLEPDGKPTR